MSKEDLKKFFKNGVEFVKNAVRVYKGVRDVVRPHPRPYPPMYPWGKWAFERMEQFNRRVAMHPWHHDRPRYRPSPIFAHRHDHYR